MSRPGKAAGDADRVWQMLVNLVMDSRGDWRRKVSAATGLPFSRVRALKRLVDAPLTLHQLADSMSSDAPAATVAVNDLERRGLVERHAHPANRRAKLVSLTPAGKRVVDTLRNVTDQAPPGLAQLAAADLAELQRILKTLHPR